MTDCACCANVQAKDAARTDTISKLVCEKAALEKKLKDQKLRGEARSNGILEQVRVGCCHPPTRIRAEAECKAH